MPQCKAVRCKNVKGKCSKSFFQFPNPAESKQKQIQCQQWIRNLRSPRIDNKAYKWSRGHVVCEDHFTPDCFLKEFFSHPVATLLDFRPVRKRLVIGAIPTLIDTRCTCKGAVPTLIDTRCSCKGAVPTLIDTKCAYKDGIAVRQAYHSDSVTIIRNRQRRHALLQIKRKKLKPVSNGNSPPKWLADLEKDDVDLLQEFGSLTAAQLMEKVRGLQNLAYQLGLEEAREMTRGKFLNILSKGNKRRM